MPAAAQLARDIVARLLLAALQKRSFDIWFVARTLVFEQETLQNLTSDQVEALRAGC
jgi:hypothetical protein